MHAPQHHLSWLLQCPKDYKIAQKHLVHLEHFHLGGDAILDAAINRIGLPYAKHLIEFGCGLGGVGRFMLLHAPQTKITGYDTHARLCQINQAINKHLNIQQYQVMHQNLFKVNIPDHACLILCHITLMIGIQHLCNYLKNQNIAEIWLLEPVILQSKKYPYPQIWADHQKADKLTNAEQIHTHFKKIGFSCKARTDLSEVAQNFNPPKPVKPIPRLIDIAPIANFYTKIRNGKIALEQRMIGLMAAKYERTALI
ncbi:MAG: class I SAM-dependent methyltransferase [Pseudomonadota bacterium]